MKELTRKRILVTGGAGFLGSHLCERLVAQGHDVLCVDNFYTGTKDNIAHLLDCANFQLLRHDVTFPLYVEVDEIYNLAYPASPVHYQHDPVQTTKTSVHGAINMLGLANRQQHGLSIRIAWIFNIYGPHMHPADGRVVSNFMMQALRGEPLTVYGDGSQTSSFCYVDDMIDAFIRLMNVEDDLGGPVNLGNPHEVSMREIAERIVRTTRSASTLELRRLPADDAWHRQPDVARASTLLGWQPTTSLDHGLELTAGYFRQRVESALQRAPRTEDRTFFRLVTLDPGTAGAPEFAYPTARD